LLSAPCPILFSSNSAFSVRGCVRQYCFDASIWAPSLAAACQGRGAQITGPAASEGKNT